MFSYSRNTIEILKIMETDITPKDLEITLKKT